VALGASNPWDFQTYYYAAHACRAHLNPYDIGALSAVAGKPVALPFVYPPVALLPFLLLSFLPLPVASLVWLGLKVCLLVALLAIWRREFLREVPDGAMLGVALFGFNAAALWDLRAGNVATVETFLLWTGVLSYVRGKTVCSARRIAAASAFKIAPIAFLGMLLVGSASRKKKALAIGVGVALLAALLAVSWPITVEWARAFPRAIAAARPTGEINPSALGILDGILGERHRALALPLFGLYALIITLAATPAIRKLRKMGCSEEWVMLAITLWILLSPRVMIYSYLLMAAPALFVVRNAISGPGARALGYFLLMAQGLVRLLPGQPPAALAEGPFILTIVVFAILVARIRGGEDGPVRPT
jgi:hypothetical protein